jgi:30S ribosomal protein S31
LGFNFIPSKIPILLNFRHSIKTTFKAMGKGDKKTKRGKIHRGTFGAKRPRIKKKPSVELALNINEKPRVK